LTGRSGTGQPARGEHSGDGSEFRLADGRPAQRDLFQGKLPHGDPTSCDHVLASAIRTTVHDPG